MLTSVYLARLIGPVMLAVGIGALLNAATFRAIVGEFLKSPALMYLSGLIIMPTGLAIALAHRVIAPDWRLLVTLIGWLMLIGGAIRIALPDMVIRIGRRFNDTPGALTITAAIWLIIGAILTIAGYWPQTPTP
jgi:predicted signal transduction protein with EAL and GGDEF domain